MRFLLRVEPDDKYSSHRYIVRSQLSSDMAPYRIQYAHVNVVEA